MPGSRRSSGELESEIMATLWASDQPLTPTAVRDALGAELAYNTVQTILVRLYDKGLVSRAPSGRGHAYSPTVRHADRAADQMHALLEHGPDHDAVLQRFVSSLSHADETALRRLLRRRRSR